MRRLAAAFVLAALLQPVHAGTEPEWRYTVRPGDTLIGIGQRYLARPADWPKVQTRNRVADPYRMMPGTVLAIPLTLLRQEPAPVRVENVSGTVRVTLPGEDARALRVDERLPAGSVVEVADKGSVRLRFADGSTTLLTPGTRLVLDTVSVYAGGGMVDTRLRLQQGRLEVGANPQRIPGSRLQVITPSAVAAVRGTVFRVGADETATRQETLEGAVMLAASGQTVQVAASEGSLAEAGRPPLPPRPLLPAPDLSALPAELPLDDARLAWVQNPNARGWLVQVWSDGAEGALLAETQSSGATVRLPESLAAGAYRIVVRALDEAGLHGHDAEHRLALYARAAAPRLVAPRTPVRTETPEIRWDAVPDAEAYRVIVSRDGQRVAEAEVAGTVWRVTPALEPGDYQIRLAARVAGRLGRLGDPEPLRYVPPPAAPDLAAAAAHYEAGRWRVELGAPPPGMRIEARFMPQTGSAAPGAHLVSETGSLVSQPVPRGEVALEARIVDADGTASPFARRALVAPRTSAWPLLFLLPLLFVR